VYRASAALSVSVDLSISMAQPAKQSKRSVLIDTTDRAIAILRIVGDQIGLS
jgi:hypothetical protein